MPIIEAATKAKIKTKLLVARNNTTDADEALDALVDALYEIIKELLLNATVTGTCGGAGSPLTLGKIT
ncbi:hypothetical protein OMO38_10260 [Chryseobacterium sp. 09-1422]|uniref:Uncharacterized protein n=1 Tax=Chryseobacterium kimseyorum TaxID=2984028 RepID=A0ABT3HYL8_9FLAO|nr:hypothetical protein [Chryseobacterium kimseyorum]MCW3168904.1 hypothetical protein [Chryseobacterium kimseyorum]